MITEECTFHEEDHSFNVANLYKYTSDDINPSEDIIFPAMVGSEPLPVDDSEQSNIVSQNSFDSVDNDIDPVEESEDTPPSIESDINTSMGVNVDKPEMQKNMSNQFYGGVLEFLCKYDNSDTGCHPFDPAKSDDAHSVSTYVLNHDLGQKRN